MALRGGFFPVNRAAPLRRPAVEGSTLKYDGSGSFFGSACAVGLVCVQPPRRPRMQRIVREWTGLIFGGRQTGFVFNAEALRTQRKRREKQKQGRLTVAARIASLVCSAAAEVDRCGSISCRLRSSLPRSLSAPRSGLSPC